MPPAEVWSLVALNQAVEKLGTPPLVRLTLVA